MDVIESLAEVKFQIYILNSQDDKREIISLDLLQVVEVLQGNLPPKPK